MSSPIIIAAPSSKSLSHRALIAASLARGTSRLSGVLESDDTLRTMDILRRCGAAISRVDNGTYTVTGIGGKTRGNGTIDCAVGESGTTCRLLTAVLAATQGSFYFHGTGRMHERPMQDLTNILSQCGCVFTFEGKEGYLPFHMRSEGLEQQPYPFDEDGIVVPSAESSQYLSGLLLTAPLSRHGMRLVFDGAGAVSKSYILLTLQTLLMHQVPFTLEFRDEGGKSWKPWQLLSPDHRASGTTACTSQVTCPGQIACSGKPAKARCEGQPGQEHYGSQWPQAVHADNEQVLQLLHELKHSPVWDKRMRITILPHEYQTVSCRVEGDYSGASYLLAAGALGTTPVTVTGLNPHSLQGDAAILDIMKRMGAHVSWSELNGHAAVTVSPAPLRGVDLDMGDCPDLVPTVTMLAARASGPTTITNVSHLALKESNRLLAPAQELAKVGCTATITGDSMIIYPLTAIANAKPVLSSHDDHRIAMSLALLELGEDVTIRLDNDHCVAKSYPGFWRDWSHIRPHTNLGKHHGS